MFKVDKIKHNDKNSHDFDFEIALCGNPNVGKSTVFNALTGLKQHTGNWSGKTVSTATGYYMHKNSRFKIVDLPGVYSLNSNSDEEIIANNYLDCNDYHCVVIVIDGTNLERNLNLVLQILRITSNAVLCINMYDDVIKKGIVIDIDELSLQLGIPIVVTSASNKSGLYNLKDTIEQMCNNRIKTYAVNDIKTLGSDNYDEYISNIYKLVSKMCNKCLSDNNNKHNNFDRKLDNILTSKLTGIPIMLLLLSMIFWITIVGANYVSDALMHLFSLLYDLLSSTLCIVIINDAVISFLLDGVYTTLTFVVAVMLPPMAIFFPLFSLIEDFGLLPRIALNLDPCFEKVGGHGKQTLTTIMGFGCNACGVTGCRIIDSQREKNIAIATNSLIPCNGKLPTLIIISSIFFVHNHLITSLFIVMLIILSVMLTFLASHILSKTFLKGNSTTFMLELPPYRKPQILKTIIYSLKDRALFVLLRAILVAAPSGAIIWCLANLEIKGETLLNYLIEFLNPASVLLGLDGVIVVAVVLGFCANETIVPTMLMAYTANSMMVNISDSSQLHALLINNGWTIITAVCFIILFMYHLPCSTTCLTIYKETKDKKLTMISMLTPLTIGVVLCLITNAIAHIFA